MTPATRLSVITVLGGCLAACGIEVTTIGAVSSSVGSGDDASPDIAVFFNDTGAGGETAPDSSVPSDSSSPTDSLVVGDSTVGDSSFPIDGPPSDGPPPFDTSTACSDGGADAIAAGFSVVPTPAAITHFTSVSMTVAGEPWVLGVNKTSSGADGGETGGFRGALLHYKSGWLTIDVPIVADAVWASGPDQAWVVGTDYLAQANSTTVVGSWAPPIKSTDLKAVWGADATHVWAAGTTMMKTSDGVTWTQEDLVGGFDTVTGLWGSSATNVWAVSEGRKIRHMTGTTWTVDASIVAPFSLRAIWGSAANDVWAVGDNGTILRFDGASWSTFASGTTANLHGVFGSARDDVWIVGDGCAIFHWDSATLTTYASPAIKLAAVAAVSTTSAWAVGDNTVLRYK